MTTQQELLAEIERLRGLLDAPKMRTIEVAVFLSVNAGRRRYHAITSDNYGFPARADEVRGGDKIVHRYTVEVPV